MRIARRSHVIVGAFLVALFAWGLWSNSERQAADSQATEAISPSAQGSAEGTPRAQLAVGDVNWDEVLSTAISYHADSERGEIIVFADPTCSGCQALFGSLPDFLTAGVTVRFLAFPKAGASSNAGHLLSAAWCNENQKSGLYDAFNYLAAPSDKCLEIVSNHHALGVALGVAGTPTIIFNRSTIAISPPTVAEIVAIAIPQRGQ